MAKKDKNTQVTLYDPNSAPTYSVLSDIELAELNNAEKVTQLNNSKNQTIVLLLLFFVGVVLFLNEFKDQIRLAINAMFAVCMVLSLVVAAINFKGYHRYAFPIMTVIAILFFENTFFDTYHGDYKFRGNIDPIAEAELAAKVESIRPEKSWFGTTQEKGKDWSDYQIRTYKLNPQRVMTIEQIANEVGALADDIRAFNSITRLHEWSGVYLPVPIKK